MHIGHFFIYYLLTVIYSVSKPSNADFEQELLVKLEFQNKDSPSTVYIENSLHECVPFFCPGRMAEQDSGCVQICPPEFFRISGSSF